MPKPLVIVESPAKAKTIARILGGDFVVESSIGHIRDLPPSADEIPAAYKSESWARLGVDVDNDFKPLYIVPSGKKKQVTKLKSLLKGASELYLATDEDREGESIAWHLTEVLSPTIPVKRMVFHEITPHAVRLAVENPRDLDRRLVDAQEGRRILDRLYGYEVSPVLWKKVLPGLSAGRVQSVATRLVVEREKARIRFRSASYWDIEGRFGAESDLAAPSEFAARLVTLEGERLGTGKDFDESGQPTRAGIVVLAEAEAQALSQRLEGADFTVSSVEEKPYTKKPYAPFITSTLQQEAGRKLRFTSQRTMQTAQRLYENGYITYMRTDSITLSNEAIEAARDLAARLYGPEYVAPEPRRYKSKVKNAQEAHEAIRPAGETFRMPEEVAAEVGDDEGRLYELIWKRTLASEMADARGQSVQVRLGARSSEGEDVEFAASGRVIDFFGFMRAYVEGADDPDAELEDRELRLPRLSEGQAVTTLSLEPQGHSTQPPSRYSEAALIKELEERGIGRPSTYASIISTILDRGYVWKKSGALVPSWTAFSVIGLLEGHFPRLVDYEFTAAMEEDLDEIANGEEETVPWLRKFYFGNGEVGLHALVNDHLDEIDPREINSIPVGRDAEGRELVLRVGRYGPYLQRGDDTASVPEDLPPDELTADKAQELLDAPSDDRVLGVDPDTGLEVHVKTGRYGPYVQLGEIEDGSKEKPATASLFKSMEPKTVTLDEALRLLGLPRVVGEHPDDGEEILALNGRYGPFLKKGKDTRSLEGEEQIFDITLDEAVALFAEPKRGRRRGAAVLKELGEDPTTGKTVSLRSGRYGPYVTDGDTNASLPRGDNPDDLTHERAVELLAEKRAKGPAKKKRKTTRKRK
ncbi:MAG: type I DNA topoisomerase [Actinomycetota bacterium]